MKIYSFGKRERLQKTQDFERVIKGGRSFFNEHIKLRCVMNELVYNRYAVVLNRKIGIAVNRNRLKRRVREIIRLNKPLIKKAYDIIIFPKNCAIDMDFERLRTSLLELIKKAGLKDG